MFLFNREKYASDFEIRCLFYCHWILRFVAFFFVLMTFDTGMIIKNTVKNTENIFHNKDTIINTKDVIVHNIGAIIPDNDAIILNSVTIINDTDLSIYGKGPIINDSGKIIHDEDTNTFYLLKNKTHQQQGFFFIFYSCYSSWLWIPRKIF